MFRLYFSIFSVLFGLGAHVFSSFSAKAKLFIRGRKGQWPKIEEFGIKNRDAIWVACSSLGEFEQVRPIIELLKQQYPSQKIVLTFFSPSGYEARKNYPLVDGIFYLPLDSAKNAKQWFKAIMPKAIVFVKYDLWYFYLAQAEKLNIPRILVAAHSSKKPAIAVPIFRVLYKKFNTVCAQYPQSISQLKQLGAKNIVVAGDPRADRNLQLVNEKRRFDDIEKWVGNSPLLVAGSVWPQDIDALALFSHDIKMLLVPHEFDENIYKQIKSIFPDAIRYSEWTNNNQSDTLVIDKMGMLASLYQYATVAYLGGAFKQGLHNILEPAAWGKPIVFGPKTEKFPEAQMLIELGAAFSVSDAQSADDVFHQLLTNNQMCHQAGMAARHFIESNQGAAQKNLAEILRFLNK